MAGLAHLGVGLAAKRAAPRIPLAILVSCAYAIDIVFLVVWFLGVERLPQGRKRKGGDLHAASKRPALYLDARRRMRRRTAAGSTTAPTGNRIQTLLTRSSQSPNAGP